MTRPSRKLVRNILVIARREFLWRSGSRTFILSTLFLVLAAIAVGLAPTILRVVNRLDTGDTIGVYVGTSQPSVDFAPALQSLLNATRSTEGSAGQGSGGSALEGTASGGTGTASGGFKAVAVSDLATARADVTAGRLKAVLALDRTPTGDLAYTLYSGMQSFERTAQLIQQSATALSMQDRLARAGIPPGDQAALFAPAAFSFEPADPAAAGKETGSVEQLVGGSIIGFTMTIFIFMAIVVYGQWVAMSVAEEKSSRVMEVVLGAATPNELMTGKVVGVGGLAIVQYVAVFVPAAAAILLQDRIASLILGGSASLDLPAGLTVPILVAFGIFFVLGFALYATLFAGVASLVSRQEDISQLITPLVLVSTAGYMVAVYASSGLIPIDSLPVVLLSYVPLVSPYLMMTRLTMATVAPWEPVVAVLILLLTIAGALWLAGRLYAAGVLMYGQKPGFRTLLRALRPA